MPIIETLTPFTLKDSELVINEDGDDLDFRVEASGVADALVVQGSDGNVGVGVAAPADKLDVDGSLFVRGDNIWLKGQGDDTAPRLRLHHSGSNAYVDWETGGLHFRYDATARLKIAASGNIGIGTDGPDTQLEISKDSANAEATISSYHNTEATTPKLTLRKADGSEASPALVDDNAVLGTISFQGHDGSGFEEGAKIEARVNGTPSDGTDMPTELSLWTTPDGSNTAVQRMTVLANGNVGVGVAAPTAELDVDGELFVRGNSIWLKGKGDDAAQRLRLHHSGSDVYGVYIDWEAGPMHFRSDTTERIVFTAGGDIQIATAGAGIDFSAQASPAAGMTDELLDRYEEGTWTPAFYNITDGSAITATYGGEIKGYYTRVGRQVTLTCFLRTNAITAPASSKRVGISGIPFLNGLSETANHPHARSLLLYSNWSTPPKTFSIGQNEAYIRLFTAWQASWINTDPLTGNHLYDGTNNYKNEVSFSITYHI